MTGHTFGLTGGRVLDSISSFEDCTKQCELWQGGQCKSVDYNNNTKTCILSGSDQYGATATAQESESEYGELCDG